MLPAAVDAVPPLDVGQDGVKGAGVPLRVARARAGSRSGKTVVEIAEAARKSLA